MEIFCSMGTIQTADGCMEIFCSMGTTQTAEGCMEIFCSMGTIQNIKQGSEQWMLLEGRWNILLSV
jgi:hypothetical protein